MIWLLHVHGLEITSEMLEWLAELREAFYLLDHWFIINRFNSEKAKWKRCIRQGMWEGHGASMFSTGACLSLHLSVFTNLGSPPTPSSWVVIEASLHRHTCQWQLIQFSSLLQFPGGQGVKSHLINITKDTFFSPSIQEIPRVPGSCEPGTVDDQIHISYKYNTQ